MYLQLHIFDNHKIPRKHRGKILLSQKNKIYCELQRNGKIGIIDVSLETKGGKANGEIIIPSSLDKAETAIIGAAL